MSMDKSSHPPPYTISVAQPPPDYYGKMALQKVEDLAEKQAM